MIRNVFNINFTGPSYPQGELSSFSQGYPIEGLGLVAVMRLPELGVRPTSVSGRVENASNEARVFRVILAEQVSDLTTGNAGNATLSTTVGEGEDFTLQPGVGLDFIINLTSYLDRNYIAFLCYKADGSVPQGDTKFELHFVGGNVEQLF